MYILQQFEQDWFCVPNSRYSPLNRPIDKKTMNYTVSQQCMCVQCLFSLSNHQIKMTNCLTIVHACVYYRFKRNTVNNFSVSYICCAKLEHVRQAVDYVLLSACVDNTSLKMIKICRTIVIFWYKFHLNLPQINYMRSLGQIMAWHRAGAFFTSA